MGTTCRCSCINNYIQELQESGLLVTQDSNGRTCSDLPISILSTAHTSTANQRHLACKETCSRADPFLCVNASTLSPREGILGSSQVVRGLRNTLPFTVLEEHLHTHHAHRNNGIVVPLYLSTETSTLPLCTSHPDMTCT